jgi:hypothetical protein
VAATEEQVGYGKVMAGIIDDLEALARRLEIL